MKKTWKNPAKEQPRESTMQTPGDFEEFTELMRKVVAVKPPGKQKAVSMPSASLDPAAS